MMNEFLAQAYGTLDSTDNGYDMQKTAEFELFAKVAADENIDLSALSDEQVGELYSVFQAKLAEEDKKDGEEAPKASDDKAHAEEDEADKAEKEKKAAAEYEFLMAKQAQDELNRADYCGRVMAHAYVNEMKKIAADLEKEAKMPRMKDVRKGIETASASAKKKLKNLGASAKEHAEAMVEKAKKHPKTTAGLAAGAGAAGGYAAGKKKESSAIDQLAGEFAVKLAAEDGTYDPEKVGEALDTLFESGELADSTKVAMAGNTDEAIHVRALELLEQIGVPVTWNV